MALDKEILSTKGMNHLSPVYSPTGPNPWHFESAMQGQKMPFYYDALGQKQVNYAYVCGPHYGSLCECEECVKFNAEMQNRDEQQALYRAVSQDATKTMHYYVRSPSLSSPGILHQQGIDVNTAIQIMLEFTCKHIAEYQKTMMKKVHQMQIEHTSQMRAMRSKLAEKRIDLPVTKNPSGRMFREGEKAETSA